MLTEDAMIVYRITRAPERRVFYIDVGNIDPKDIKGYMQDVAAIVVRLRTVMTQETQVIALAKELSLEFRGDIKLKKEEVVEAKQINHAGIKEVNDLAARYTGGYPGGDVTDAYGDLK